MTPLQPHQQRVIDKLKASHGVLVAHGVGSGKTLASIAAAEAMGLPIEAIVPAPLIANYHKEMAKHLGKEPGDARVRSYEKVVRDKDINLNALAIMDEAHRARNAGTQVSKHVAGQVAKAKARLLLTGTPVYNQPYDLAALLNTAAGRKVLPDDPALFKKTFVGEELVQAPLLARIKGKVFNHSVDDVKLPKLINRERLISAARGYIDVHEGGGERFPDRINEDHNVEMSPKQMEMYNFHMNKMPWYLKAKIRAGLPLDKQESKDMNAFQGALRQVSNTPRPYATGMSEAEERLHTPKIRLMAKHLQEMRAQDPNFRGVVYSNYLNAGLEPLSRALQEAGISHHVFTGEVSKGHRAQMVNDYNSGKTPVLLLSGAGSEGLDLKGTKAIQLMEPHWNESRINQVIGRGIRYKSHEHLPEHERQVKVMRYTSTLPKDVIDRANAFFDRPTAKSIDQYMRTTADQKDRFTRQMSGALQEASDYGPLRKSAMLKVAKALGLPTDDKELMEQLSEALPGTSLGKKGKTPTLDYSHPADLILRSKYDPDHIRAVIEKQYGGDVKDFARQLDDDLLTSGYAALGDITKKNQKLQGQRAAKWGFYGALGGFVPSFAIGRMLDKNLVVPAAVSGSRKGLLGSLGLKLVASYAVPMAVSTAAFHIGKKTYKPLGSKDMEALQTHPMLVAPKVVKQKTTLKVRE